MTPERPPSPDIVLLAPEWRLRAPLRAQLIEEGFEVLATDSWTSMRRYLSPESKPRLAIVDLQSLPDPRRVLGDLALLMKSDEVLVLAALGSLPPEEVDRLEFLVLKRPMDIDQIVEAVRRIIRRETGPQRPAS